MNLSLGHLCHWEMSTGMSTNEAADQANRPGMDPQRLVIGFYLIAVVVVGLFLDRVLGMIWAQFGWSAPREIIEGSNIGLTTLIGLALALGAAVAAWMAPRTRALSKEVASELMKVTWPSWSETRVSTLAVIIASIVSAVILFGIDTAAYKVMVDWLPVLWGKL